MRLILTIMFALYAAGCDPVALPHQRPGPVDCGLKDPRETAPGKLSLGQKKLLREKGPPGQVMTNKINGLDWVYVRRSGSVFGEEETLERLSFDNRGVLMAQDVELVYKKGK